MKTNHSLTVGVPREIKSHEYRVAVLPVGVHLLTQAGYRVLMQCGAGEGSGYSDDDYRRVGAELVPAAEAVFSAAELIVKVKEPVDQELSQLREDQVIFAYFHCAASRALTEGCLHAGVTALAYETLSVGGRLPLLTPMSEIAGRMAVQTGAKYLEKPQGGRGILLSGVPGVEPAKVTVLGGGVVGANAARLAAGLGAEVVLLDVSLDRLRYLSEVMPANVTTVHSNPHTIQRHVSTSDLVIGAVLIPGARSPVLVSREMLADMPAGSVIVDVGVDQGGCVQTTRPTTHENPTYVVDGVVHYGVTNMPGAVGRTSTQALCNATQPYLLELAAAMAANRLEKLFEQDAAFRSALNLRRGCILHPGVATTFPDLAAEPVGG